MRIQPIYVDPAKPVAPKPPYTGRMRGLEFPTHQHTSLRRLLHIIAPVVAVPVMLLSALAWVLEIFAWDRLDFVSGVALMVCALPFPLGVCALVSYGPEMPDVEQQHQCRPPRYDELGSRWRCPVCGMWWRVTENIDPPTQPIPVVRVDDPVIWWETSDVA